MFRSRLACIAAAAALCTAAHAQPQAPVQSAFDTAPAGNADAPRPTFEFARVRSKIQSNDVIGHLRKGFFCGTDGDSRAVPTIEQVTNYNGQLAFKAVTKELNVPVFERDLSPFETGTPKSADYRIGGVVQRMYFDTCSDGVRRKGSLEIEVKWEVYSTKLQRVVLSATTAGSYKSDDFVAGSFDSRAYFNSLHDFMVSDAFKSLEAGRLPEGANVPAWPPLHLKEGATIEGNAQARAEALAKAVVTIVSDNGSGTGFYIAEGYLLTDRHVVGSQRYVKVKLANGRQLVGEVVRQDAARDVALLQTEPSGTPTLRVILADPPVGASMYAIGSPLGETLAGTFTQGVLSGIREVNGTRFLQSDAAINHGNSGGPLIDATSHVVGLADLVVNQAAGLSFFVPIKDALDRLAIVVDSPPPTP